MFIVNKAHMNVSLIVNKSHMNRLLHYLFLFLLIYDIFLFILMSRMFNI